MPKKDDTTTVFLKINKDIFMLRKTIPLQYFSSTNVSLYSYGAVGFIVTKVLTENNNLYGHTPKYLRAV